VLGSLALSPLAAEERGGGELSDDPVGRTLKEVFALYGEPDEVYAARGAEEWQDDVVFVYKHLGLDLYIYKDRVWQAGVQSALGIKKGDRKSAAVLALSAIEDKGAYLLYHFNQTVWPKYARFNIDSQGKVSAIYIYRPDN
jgi:hypothetical protein